MRDIFRQRCADDAAVFGFAAPCHAIRRRGAFHEVLCFERACAIFFAAAAVACVTLLIFFAAACATPPPLILRTDDEGQICHAC